jgi:hypothetical protein
MSRAITVGDVFCVIGICIGGALSAGGILAVFAGMMSDAPGAGDATSKTGCGVFIAGLALIGLCLWGLLS